MSIAKYLWVRVEVENRIRILNNRKQDLEQLQDRHSTMLETYVKQKSEHDLYNYVVEEHAYVEEEVNAIKSDIDSQIRNLQQEACWRGRDVIGMRRALSETNFLVKQATWCVELARALKHIMIDASKYIREKERKPKQREED